MLRETLEHWALVIGLIEIGIAALLVFEELCRWFYGRRRKNRSRRGDNLPITAGRRDP